MAPCHVRGHRWELRLGVACFEERPLRCFRLGVHVALAVLFILFPLVSLGSSVPSGDGSVDDVVGHFIKASQAAAARAFESLYGDGLGFAGETPPPLEVFVENYVTQALNQETARVLKQKGYDAPKSSESGKEGRSGSLTDVTKKDAPTTLEGQIEQLLVQKRQRFAVNERVRRDKEIEVIAPQQIPPERGDTETSDGHQRQIFPVVCGETLYGEHVYDAIPGCSPGAPGGSSPPCVRFVVDGVASVHEQARMVQMMDRSFEGLFHQGSETLLVPEDSSRSRLGNEDFELTVELLERVRREIMLVLNISEIFYSGSLLKRMDYPPLNDDMQIQLEHDSFNPHVDKANIASYDYSALLYLNDVDEAFGGGEFSFNDIDKDRVVRPVGGRLLAFSSGLENLHKVIPMSWGSRYVLAIWYTCSERHAHLKLGASSVAHHGDEL